LFEVRPCHGIIATFGLVPLLGAVLALFGTGAPSFTGFVISLFFIVGLVFALNHLPAASTSRISSLPLVIFGACSLFGSKVIIGSISAYAFTLFAFPFLSIIILVAFLAFKPRRRLLFISIALFLSVFKQTVWLFT